MRKKVLCPFNSGVDEVVVWRHARFRKEKREESASAVPRNLDKLVYGDVLRTVRINPFPDLRDDVMPLGENCRLSQNRVCFIDEVC